MKDNKDTYIENIQMNLGCKLDLHRLLSFFRTMIYICMLFHGNHVNDDFIKPRRKTFPNEDIFVHKEISEETVLMQIGGRRFNKQSTWKHIFQIFYRKSNIDLRKKCNHK